MADRSTSPNSSTGSQGSEDADSQEGGLERLSDAMEAWREFMARSDALSRDFLVENEPLRELLEPLMDAWRVRQAAWLRGREDGLAEDLPKD